MLFPTHGHGRGMQVVIHQRLRQWTTHRRRDCRSLQTSGLRSLSQVGSKLRSGGEELKESKGQMPPKHKLQKQTKAIDKDFFLSVLGSSATKRDAKAYLQRFNPQISHSAREAQSTLDEPNQLLRKTGVNLGGLYSTRAIAESPRFISRPTATSGSFFRPILHVALVKVREPQSLKDSILDGVAKTLSQLSRLGLLSIVVVDTGQVPDSRLKETTAWRNASLVQGNRLAAAIESHDAAARIIDNVIGVSERSGNENGSGCLGQLLNISYRKLLMTPLKRGMIPIIPNIGYTEQTQRAMAVEANDVVLALTRELAGLQFKALPGENPLRLKERVRELRSEVSIDRLIILDPLGGIPATDQANGCHLFLNMQQDFESIRSSLIEEMKNDGTRIAAGNLAGRPAVKETTGPVKSTTPQKEKATFGPLRDLLEPSKSLDNHHHVRNLALVNQVLGLLPPSSSALLTTPFEASNSSKEPTTPFRAAEVGTRRHRNPLIHNLLTDKPVFSPSLPRSRFSSSEKGHDSSSTTIAPTTFAKHGTSVTIFPDPRLSPWFGPRSQSPTFSLRSPHLDLARLVYLIEDSFGRTLDVSHYLERVNKRLAGVIIAGEYEGGAVMTWELPPGVVDDGSEAARSRWMLYLDKFAVLKRSQGSGGVAEVVFKALAKDCAAAGCVWRSRKNNPVNKWYFERAQGSYKLPDSDWTMFFTTPEDHIERQRFLDYVSICSSIEPSWADKKDIED